MLLNTLVANFFGLVSAVNFSATYSRWRKLLRVALKNDLEILKKKKKKKKKKLWQTWKSQEISFCQPCGNLGNESSY
jgi:hypothetical protein